MSNTSRRYDCKTLAFFLADLGEKLGRPPKPSDLKKGMPSRSTFMRYFGDWDTALEYAGYTKQSQDPDVELINLLGIPVKIIGPNDESKIIQPSGKASIIRSLPKVPCAMEDLASQIVDCSISTFRLKMICVELPDGTHHGFPAYEERTYYIVSEAVARNIYRFGRTSNDMIFARPRKSRLIDNVLCISAFQMVYTNSLPIKEE